MPKKTLVLGSCRLVLPFLSDDDLHAGGMPPRPNRDAKDAEYVTYPGGHTHSTGDVIQAIKIMKSELKVPEYLDPYVFHGWGVRSDKIIDFDGIDRVVLEISSVKNYVHRGSGLILHIGYGDNVNAGKLKALDDVNFTKELEAEVLSNLDLISKMTRKPLVLVCQHNIQQIPVRYWLSHLLSTWCGSNHTFIDPTLLVAVYGIDKCFPVLKGKRDFQHYSTDMQTLIREYIKGSLKLDNVPLYKNKLCPST